MRSLPMMLGAAHPDVPLFRRTPAPRRLPILRLHAPRLDPGRVMVSYNPEAPEAVVGEGQEKHIFIENKPRDILERMDAIRAALQSMGDGEINASAYATAWVALVKNLDGGDGPQFPSCVDWIVQNQLPDGSWGDENFFLVQDRIINTLACIIALKSWNIHDDKWRKGLSFIHQNLWRLNEDEEDWMLGGCEISLPTLLDMAKDLGIDMPYNEPSLNIICAKRDLKLARIPRDVLHTVPTTLLFSIEGMPGLDWEKLFMFQCSDGSIASSPAPTAYALMQTGNKKCLRFLDRLVREFNGGVPYIYPVDIFERLWVVDRLERLGISRYFTSEIKKCLDHVYRHQTHEGFPAMRDCPVKDVDDTAMGFRLLRLHGYHVSPCVFKPYEKDGEFFCYTRQSSKSVTAMYSLYRAAQVAFPGEDELGRAKIYCQRFLGERRTLGTLKDKWVISKDLPGEVGYALDFPWKASLPRVETRMYLEQYGGSADVWIGKSLYRMHLVNNDLFLDAAKADFSHFQRLSQLEWHGLRKWFDKHNLQACGMTLESALRMYFLAAANIFEPNRAAERLSWARTALLSKAISWYLQCNDCMESKRDALICKLRMHGLNELASGENPSENALVCALGELFKIPASDDACHDLRESWDQWLRSWRHESFEGTTALLLVRAIEICSGRYNLTKEDANDEEYSQLEQLTYSICGKLGSRVNDRNGENMVEAGNLDEQVELEMQELVQCVLQSWNSINKVTRQTFLHVAKSYYYVAHCGPETIASHISTVIFEDVV